MCEIWRRKHRTYELMILIFFEDERGSIVKECFGNSLSWNRITLEDTTGYELQRTMSDPRRFHDLKKFSINIVVSSKLDFVCDPRCAKIKITFTRDIESQSIIKGTIFNLRRINYFSVVNFARNSYYECELCIWISSYDFENCVLLFFCRLTWWIRVILGCPGDALIMRRIIWGLINSIILESSQQEGFHGICK